MAALARCPLVEFSSVLREVGGLEGLVSILVVRRAVVDGFVVAGVTHLLARADVLADDEHVVEAPGRVLHCVGAANIERLQVNSLV